eukprot:3195741-Rhodomonas_salina.1
MRLYCGCIKTCVCCRRDRNGSCLRLLHSDQPGAGRERGNYVDTMAQVWNADGLSQEDLMLKDQCILLDMNDNIIGYDNKYESHIFCPERPRAKLHRAFSVFLFDESGKLLLQQRAKEKITFPEVWTNTCCSHPLTGCVPPEEDSPEDVANGTVMGVKNAAVRKLK